jgi:hypothetical protein
MSSAIREQGDTATIAKNSSSLWKRSATPYEHLFFSGMAILILGTVALGFARTV